MHMSRMQWTCHMYTLTYTFRNLSPLLTKAIVAEWYKAPAYISQCLSLSGSKTETEPSMIKLFSVHDKRWVLKIFINDHSSISDMDCQKPFHAIFHTLTHTHAHTYTPFLEPVQLVCKKQVHVCGPSHSYLS